MIRTLVNEALASLDGRFGEIHLEIGRPSISPEQLLRAMPLQAFCSVRSERQSTEQLDVDLPFRPFAGLGIDDAVWDASTFSKDRGRLLAGSVAGRPGLLRAGAMPRWTATASASPTTRTRVPQTPRRGSTARGGAARPSSASRAVS